MTTQSKTRTRYDALILVQKYASEYTTAVYDMNDYFEDLTAGVLAKHDRYKTLNTLISKSETARALFLVKLNEYRELAETKS